MAKLAITPVGQILRERTLISEEALQQALAEQQRSHDRLGRILLTQGHISAFALHSALAEHYGLEFVNLSHTPADALLQNADRSPICATTASVALSAAAYTTCGG